MPRSSVNDANKHLRPTVREGDDGRSAVSFNGAGHPGATMCETVLRLDPSDAEIPAAAGLSAGTMLPVKITARKFELIGKFPVATQEEYDALTDAQKDQATILGLDEAPIGSEAKCYEHDGAGNVIDCLTWIRRGSGWTNGLGTLSPSGDVAVPGAILASNTIPTKPNASWSPFPIGNVSPSSTTGAVGQLIARMPCEFSRVRVWAGNNSGAPVTAITKILAAVSTTEGWIPSVGGALTEDQTTGWITADPDGITVPAASASIGAQEVPSYGPSVIFEISSIPASDGGRPWLFLRHPWAAANIGYRWLESSDHLYNPQDLTGSYSRYRRVVNADYSYCAANAEAGGTALAGAAADNYLCPIFRIDVWSTKDGWVTFDAIGGSTFSQTANNSETYALSWMRKANAEMIGDTANIVTLGVPGATTAHYYAMAQKAIAMSHSQYLLYSVFSGNDGSFAQAAVDAMMRRFFSVKNLARDAGKMAIPVVMIHDSVGGNSGLNAIRNAAVAQLEAAGPVLNLGDILGQASNKNLFVPAYTTDGVHFSQAGNDRATAWLPGALQDIRNRFPVW